MKKHNYSIIAQWILGGIFALTSLVNGFHWTSILFVFAGVLVMPIPKIRELFNKLNTKDFQIKTWMIITVASLLFAVGSIFSPMVEESESPAPNSPGYSDGITDDGSDESEESSEAENKGDNTDGDAPSSDIPSEDPPVDNPPVDNPPVDNPPVDNPPVDNPPVDNPPEDDPPVDNPPVDNPPADDPPVDKVGTMVWIPNTGTKYHTNPECSNMIDPREVTLEEAKELGYEPCKRCH